MSKDSDRWTAAQLAEEAVRFGIPLGRNPERTIKYYKSLGLLKAFVIQEGSVRRAYYSPDHIVTLKMIERRQKQGKSLAAIKADLDQLIYLSAEGRAFVSKFQGEYPADAFVPGAPVTRAEVAFLLMRAYEHLGAENVLAFMQRAFVLANGEPAGEDLPGIYMPERSSDSPQ